MKKIGLFMAVMILVLSFTACGKKTITLNLSFGDREGQYTGEMKNDLPHGTGKFKSTNSNGGSWVYEGEFVNGHFEGEGKTKFDNGTIEMGTYKNDVLLPISKEEQSGFLSNPSDYKGKCIELNGRVFGDVETADGICTFQIYTDVENLTGKVYVISQAGKTDIADGTYVKVIGVVQNPVKGKNVFGVNLSVPAVAVRSLEVTNYVDAVSPTLKAVEMNQTITQNGYSVTVQKVEFAQKETRVYVKIDNQGSGEFDMYSFDCLIVQGGKQYTEQSNFDADYPEIQTDLLVGNSTEGILAFPTINMENFSIVLEGSSDNYREKFKPFEYAVDVK